MNKHTNDQGLTDPNEHLDGEAFKAADEIGVDLSLHTVLVEPSMDPNPNDPIAYLIYRYEDGDRVRSGIRFPGKQSVSVQQFLEWHVFRTGKVVPMSGIPKTPVKKAPQFFNQMQTALEAWFEENRDVLLAEVDRRTLFEVEYNKIIQDARSHMPDLSGIARKIHVLATDFEDVVLQPETWARDTVREVSQIIRQSLTEWVTANGTDIHPRTRIGRKGNGPGGSGSAGGAGFAVVDLTAPQFTDLVMPKPERSADERMAAAHQAVKRGGHISQYYSERGA